MKLAIVASIPGLLFGDRTDSTSSTDGLCLPGGTCYGTPTNTLRPNDVVEPIRVFGEWRNSTVQLPAGPHILAEGFMHHYSVDVTSKFDVLAGVVTQEEVRAILRVLDRPDVELPFDSDPDSVDAMSSHEIFVKSTDEPHEQMRPGMKLDNDPTQLASRKKIRAKLNKIMDPIINDRITPYVQQRFPRCRGREGGCKACYSLVRRYKPEERRSHGVHYDSHAYVTAVVSLANYGAEYRGGLFVATSHNSQSSHILPLMRGDAVFHQSDLLHGVQLVDDGGVRWSWILWFRDTPKCDDSTEYLWFEECARKGNAVCEYLYATKIGLVPGIRENQEKTAREILRWNRKAAKQGFGPALVKVARAYLKLLPSSLSYDENKATKLFRKATETTNEPDGYYGLAELVLKNQGISGVDEAVQYLLAAARGGHTFAMFNLGIAHLYGYGVSKRNPNLAAEWFEASLLPEGFEACRMHRESVGRLAEAKTFEERSLRMGYGKPWRAMARKNVGSGGASGADINLPWPTLPGGLKPQAF